MVAEQTNEKRQAKKNTNEKVVQAKAVRRNGPRRKESEANCSFRRPKAETAMTHALGRRSPMDWEHVEKYPLTVNTAPSQATPVVLGINWYDNFDKPELVSNHWMIGRGDLGVIRGGHAICAKPQALRDNISWWKYYNQQAEGACVGFSVSRSLSLMNRERYDGEWNYNEAKKIDDWEGEDYDGTALRAGLEVVRTLGPVRVIGTKSGEPDLTRGISNYRWALSVDAIVAALALFGNRVMMDRLQAIPLLNSWGKDYPWVVWMPYRVLERLLKEEGEAGIVTDK
jgi:hypothetical protein